MGLVASARTVTLPGAQALTVRVNAAAAPLASAGSAQVAVPGSPVQAGVHDVAVRLGGSRMLAVTSAVAGPALATARMQVPWWPVVMARGQDRAAKTSARGGTGR